MFPKKLFLSCLCVLSPLYSADAPPFDANNVIPRERLEDIGIAMGILIQRALERGDIDWRMFLPPAQERIVIQPIKKTGSSKKDTREF